MPDTPDNKKKREKCPIFYLHDSIARKNPLYAIELQKLLGLCFFPQKYNSWPTWAYLKHPLLIKSVVLAIYDGFPPIVGDESSLHEMFDKFVNIFSPSNYGYSWLEEILMVPSSFLTQSALELVVSGQPVNTHIARKRPADLQLTLSDLLSNKFPNETPPITKKLKPSSPFPLPSPLSDDVFDRTLLLLNLDQMILERMPLPFEYDGNPLNMGDYSSMNEFEPVTASSPMFAIDCEMVLTIAGSELARVTIVDELGCVLLDQLVKPKNPVEDYLTRYSGITREMLAAIDTQLCDIHDELRKLLPGDAILVGHSIANDLKALQFVHPYLIDTSVIFNMSQVRSGKPRLRNLAQAFLGRVIQGGKKGHSSAEDAKATLDLVRLKLSQSLDFGDVTTSWRFPEDYLKFPVVDNHESNTSLDAVTKASTPPKQCKSSAAHFAELVSNGCRTVPHILRFHVQFLLKAYIEPAPPIHFVDRLLSDAKITSLVALDEASTHSSESASGIISEPIVSDQENVSSSLVPENEIRPAMRRPGKKSAHWLAEVSKKNRFVIGRVGRPAGWDTAKEASSLVKFAKSLYERLAPHSLVIFLCAGETNSGTEKTQQTSLSNPCVSRAYISLSQPTNNRI